MVDPAPLFAAVKTTCPYCGVGCGIVATPDGSGGAMIEGDKDHPANFGRLCSKGSALGETLGLETRLLHPIVKGARATWDLALDYTASHLKKIIDTHGPDAVAFYLSGQLLSEDYYIANKLMKGFIGSANVDTNSRLCMSSSVAGHKRSFGSDTVPGCYEDLDEGDLFVLTGSNAAWCHPILYQRMIKAQETRGAQLINIDPRRTASSEGAALHLAIAPGQDGTLFCGLLVHLADHEHLDKAFVAAHTEGFAEALQRAREIAPDVATTASRTHLRHDDVERFFNLWASTERVVTLYSQGVNQSAQGTDKVGAILNCHLATRRIGRPGMGPFSLTGQPNAMGGREVGGLANQLAAHMDFGRAEIDRVRRFWNAPNMATRPGLKAVDMFEAIDSGKIKALWVMGTNPAVSLPRADDMRTALGKLDLFILSENVSSNDTLRAGAHVLLPAAAWGEKNGTVTNSERRISRQRPFLPLAGEARPDWWAVAQLAKRLGFAGFDYKDAAAIFAEHAALSAFENNGTRDFDLGGLTHMTPEDYDCFEPVQWPLREGETSSRSRLFADGAFYTPSSKAKFIAIEPPQLAEKICEKFPLLLNTGRLRDQWHTMTRTGLSQRLGSHSAEPCLSIHPHDAAQAQLIDGGLARLKSANGSAILRVSITSAQERGAVFAPIHWSDETASSARVGALVHRYVDPHSGQPDAKATPVAVTPVEMTRSGFMLARARTPLPRDSYWAWEAIPDGYAARINTNADDAAWLDILRKIAPQDASLICFTDVGRRVLRAAFVANERLCAAIFLGLHADVSHWTQLRDAWVANTLNASMRRLMLSGKSLDGSHDDGPNVCACFGVPHGRIAAAIEAGCSDVAAIGRSLKAGTNCGSCIPELKRMLAHQKSTNLTREPVRENAT
jgi:assimilatory nitrate reductase catalytic subunit